MEPIYPESSADINTEIVESISVDHLSGELGLRFDAIKVSVEGDEEYLLRGAQETLKHSLEVILEYHSEKTLGKKPKDSSF